MCIIPKTIQHGYEIMLRTGITCKKIYFLKVKIIFRYWISNKRIRECLEIIVALSLPLTIDNITLASKLLFSLPIVLSELYFFFKKF